MGGPTSESAEPASEEPSPDEPSLGTPAHGAGEVTAGSGHAAARQDEILERRQLRVPLIQCLLELDDMLLFQQLQSGNR